MKKLWHKITYSGFEYCVTPHDKKTVVLLNKISAVCTLLMFAFATFTKYFTNGALLPFIFSFAVLFASLPFIHSKGWLRVGKILASILPVLIVVFVSSVMKPEGGDRYFLFVTSIVPLILFRKKSTYLALFIFNILVFLFVDWLQRNHDPFMEVGMADLHGYYVVNIISMFFILYFLMQYFIGTNSDYERELFSKNSLLDERNKEITDSILYAKRIQYALLAHQDLLNQNLSEYFVLFQPKDIVSGDFYWAAKTNNRFFLAVCDSTGHGVPGAFMSLLNISYLSEAINEKNISAPNEVLNHVRQKLIENISGNRFSADSGKNIISEGMNMQDGMDAILFCIDEEKNEFSYAAAHNAPLLIRKNTIIALKADKMPVGKGTREDSFSLNTIQFQKGDMLYLYTDGFADQFGGEKGKKFKESNLKKLLVDASQKSCAQQKEILQDTFEKWKSELEQVDDVCIIGVRF